MALAFQLWDPYNVLDIDKSRTRCYGWAPSKGRQCENPVAMANRDEAHRLLAKISRREASSDVVSRILDQVAHCLLCRRNHQDQATSVVDRWERRIDTFTESSTVEGDEEETTSTRNDEEEPREDLRRQMTEMHRVLRRVEIALSANLEAQRHREALSPATDSQRDPVEASRGQTSNSGDSRDNQSSTQDNAESQPGLLNIGHVQSLAKQLSLDYEASQQQDPPMSTIETAIGSSPMAGSATGQSDSSQTVIGTELKELDRELPVSEDPPVTAVSTSETKEVGTDRYRATESPVTVVGETTVAADRQAIEPRYGLSNTRNDIFAFATLPPRNDDTFRIDSLLTYKALHKKTWDESRPPPMIPQASWHTKPLWLIAALFYIGVVSLHYLLNPHQTVGALSSLPGPVMHWKGAEAKPLQLCRLAI